MNNESKTGATVTRTAVTNDRTLESIIRANMFALDKPSKKYAEAYKFCKCENMDPYAIFMSRSLDLIKMVSGPLQGSNRKPKNVLAINLINTLYEMRGCMESSAHTDSLALHFAKECSRLLFVAKAGLDALCGMDYISTSFFSKTHEVIADLYMVLKKWISIITTHAELKKNNPQL